MLMDRIQAHEQDRRPLHLAKTYCSGGAWMDPRVSAQLESFHEKHAPLTVPETGTEGYLPSRRESFSHCPKRLSTLETNWILEAGPDERKVD